jgi:two-component sensor histidine kinase
MSRRIYGLRSIGHSWSIKGHFLFFGLILASPLAALAAFLIFEIGNTIRAETEQRMSQIAAGIAADIDRDLQRRMTILQTLATSATLAEGDLAAFHAHAQMVAKDVKAGIFLVDPSLRQILNTNAPFGTPLPDYGAPEAALRTIRTRTAQVSDFFIGRIIQRPVFDLAIPVVKGEKVAYVLAMGLEPALLDEVLRDQQLSSEWIVNVADSTGTIIARSSESSKYVGTTLGSELSSQPSNTVIRTIDGEGSAVLWAVARSRISNWQVVVNVPQALADAPLNRSYVLLGLWSAVALLLTGLLATWFARGVARPIAAAASAAAGLVRRQPIAPLDSKVTEANELFAALRSAVAELSEVEKQREIAEEQRRLANIELAERVRRRAALYRFVDRLHRAASLVEIYDAALDTIIDTLRCDRASILLRDHAGVMHFVAWRGLSEPYRQAVEDHSPWARDETDPRPITVSDVAAAEMDDSLKAVVRNEGIGALAFIPLITGGKLAGKFMTYYDAPHVFEDEEIGLSQTIARQLALSVDRKRADETEKMLAAELQHRTKNLFAVIQALAHSSLRGNKILEEARQAFNRRLIVLARAHDRLVSASWKGISLSDLVHLELEAFPGRAKIDGCDVVLVAQAAQNFALALHELSTNAAKYGAFSKPEGHVCVSWTIARSDGAGLLKFRWRETGGPPVTQPTRDGFGTALLKMTLGDARIEYAPEGLIYEVDVRMDQIDLAAEASR